MTLQRTSGLTPNDYYDKCRSWVLAGSHIYAIHERADYVNQIDNLGFDLEYDPNWGYTFKPVAGQDIYKCMWACTQLLWILKGRVKLRVNGMEITWKDL